MIQDIAPKILNNQFDKEACATAEDYVICSVGNEILLKDRCEGSENCSFTQVKDWAEGTGFTYLFSIDGVRFFMPDMARFDKERLDEVPGGTHFAGVRSLRTEGMDKELNYAALTGKHITDWYRDNRRCGRCGSVMEHSSTERAMVCPKCGYTCYPRIMPAVIVACLKGDRILVSRYSKGYRHYALIAGFTEIGETLEETVEREVLEETGIHVKNIRYYKSQPWGLANDILVGFVCEADGDDEIVVDENELQDAAWMTADELDIKHDDFSMTNEMMWKFKCGEL